MSKDLELKLSDQKKLASSKLDNSLLSDDVINKSENNNNDGLKVK